ncbi:FkbM family methyltransferase [Halomonas sp. HAL1]|uniref:FkbM family methyltransferase n=1 Tax=Halomonas sp. HAL1 TaxID=550984 RepID=UPI00022D3305|nr:FkbM family methyltransferase [Halomonas sp. HAL1]EHA13920.1 hypothetical protein HAL1_19196 [Halomonas sp. HAL1]WKV94267.1 FkbM family methyltransferase [Halomonas sp. HAL1]
MANFQKISVDAAEYDIKLPHSETDYIQAKIKNEKQPYELLMLRDMASRVEANELVVDVGANIGNHTLYLAAVKGCRVYSFEPNVELCDALNESTERNGFQDLIFVHKCGVSSERGSANFSIRKPNNLGAQSLKIDDNSNGEIDLIALDDVDWPSPVKLIKIDVEGMESLVIRGARNLIEKDRPNIYVEAQSKIIFDELYKMLKGFGYCYCDSFNATPTHLFAHHLSIKESDLRASLEKRPIDIYEKMEFNELRKIERERVNKLNTKIEHVEKEVSKLKKIIEEEKQLSNQLKEKISVEVKNNKKLSEEVVSAKADFQQQSNELKIEIEKRLSLEKKLNLVSGQVRSIKQSARYQIGTHFANATKSWRNALLLPLALYRVFRRKKVKGFLLQKLKSNICRWAGYLKNNCYKHVRRKGRNDNVSDIYTPSNNPIQKRYTSDLTVACVLDEFTTECLSHEVKLIKVTQEAWQTQLEQNPPDFLLVESCWKGNDGNWGTITNGSGGAKKLSGLLRFCKQHSIPTVFWNKEDPPHYEKFGAIAALFDLAITTDVNMVPRYKEDFGIDVYPLSFGAQPKVHNPASVISRLPKAVFAGSYYGDKPKRCEDFNEVMRQLELAGISYDIFDRNYQKGIEKFAFPAHYQASIVGNLPPDQVWKAHKGYKYQVNMNSVQDSSTMFARRVYESLASGTPVISNDSVGVRELFGDIVIMPGKESIAEQLRTLEASPHTYHELAHRGVRAVMREHTYGHRIQSLCSLLGMDIMVDLPKATLAITASSEADIQRAKQLFDAQSAPRKQLFIELENFDTAYKFLNESNDTVTYAMQLAQEFYVDEGQYYGSNLVLKHNVNELLPTAALEDFIYWGAEDKDSLQPQNVNQVKVSE